MALTLMYITNNPEIAMIAQANGVDRIWIDLETLGKEERQKNMNTVKSRHTVNDIRRIVPILTTSEMLVRVNPWNDSSKEEINEVIEAGAQLIMLPMWKSVEEVRRFIAAIGGRAKSVLLLETKEAVECLKDVLELSGIDEVHIGLNDLHLSYGLSFMFELLSNGTVEYLCKILKQSEIPYGFGGIARLGMGDIPAERVITEHYRLGSTRAILSRSFCNCEMIGDIHSINDLFKKNMQELRAFERKVEEYSLDQFEENRKEVEIAVERVVSSRRREHED